MALGASDVLGSRIPAGLVVIPDGHLPADFPSSDRVFSVVVGSHPVPTASSLTAGAQLVQFTASLPADALVLCLVSGGASSLVEWPVPGIDLADLQRVGMWTMTGGQPIDVVNAVRRQLSQLKGGGLASLLGQRRTLALFISDVPGDNPRIIGSGLLHASSDSDADLHVEQLPAEIAAVLRRAGKTSRNEVPAVPYRIVASQRSARAAAARCATASGLHVAVGRQRFHGEAQMLGRKFARATARLPDRGLRIWSGESTVRLPAMPGRGGRNQHLALGAACTFEALRRDDLWLLAAGTDGIDGVTDDAGALVDAGTCVRGRDAGYECRAALDRADSGTFLEAAGDLLHTGPTFTNVGDMVIGLCWKGE